MATENEFRFRLRKLLRRTVSLLLVLILFAELSPGINYAEADWNEYTPIGIGATDIIEIAKAQMGKNGTALGQSSNWCAWFVKNCAEKVDEKEAIPTGINGDELCSDVLENGGQIVYCSGNLEGRSYRDSRYNKGKKTSDFVIMHDGKKKWAKLEKQGSISDARAGDVFVYSYNNKGYYSHVGLVMGYQDGAIDTIEGNWGGKVTSISRKPVDKNGAISLIVRPNYKNTPPKNPTYSVAYPSYGTVTIKAGAKDANIKAYPYSRDGFEAKKDKDDTNYSKHLKTAKPGEKYKVIGLHKNEYDNLWYKVIVDGKEGYLYAGHTENFTCNVAEAFTLENLTKPPNGHKKGKTFTLQGTIKSEYLYNYTLTGSISDSNKHSFNGSKSFTNNRAPFELESSAINTNLRFGQLCAGNCSYILKVKAEVNYSNDGRTMKTETREGELLNHKFTVGASKTVRFFDGDQELTTYGKTIQENNGNVTMPKHEKAGYEFVGWHASRGTGKDKTWYTNKGWQTEANIKSKGYTKKNYPAGATHSLFHSSWKTGDVSFYAQWKETPVDLSVIKDSKPTYLAITFKKGAEIHKVPHDLGDREQLAKLSKNTEFTVVGVHKNKWDNLWYEIKYNGSPAYIWAGGGNYVSYRFLDDAVSFDLSFPDQVAQETKATLTGRVTGKTNLTEVRDYFGEEIEMEEGLRAAWKSVLKWVTKKETPTEKTCDVNTTLTAETSVPLGDYRVTVAAKPQLWLTTDGKTWSDLSKGAEAQVCTWTRNFQIVERSKSTYTSPAVEPSTASSTVSAVTSTAEATARINDYLKGIGYVKNGKKVYWTHVDANGEGVPIKDRNLKNEYEELKKNARTGNYINSVSSTKCKTYLKDKKELHGFIFKSDKWSCISNVFDISTIQAHSQCGGFTHYMSYVLFLDRHMQNISGGEKWPTVDSKNYKNYSDFENSFQVHPGDVLRADGHSVMVHEVKDGKISVIEANSPSGTCQINTRETYKSITTIRKKVINGSCVVHLSPVSPNRFKQNGEKYDTYVEIRVKPGAGIMDKAAAGSTVVKKLSGTEWLLSECIEKDQNGDVWYVVSYGGVKGYVNAENYVKHRIPAGTVTGPTYDWKTHTHGKSKKITGEIKSKLLMHSVTGTVGEQSKTHPLRIDKAIKDFEFSPGGYELIYLEQSKINELKFADLKNNTRHRLQIKAKVEYYYATAGKLILETATIPVVDHYFTIGNPNSTSLTMPVGAAAPMQTVFPTCVYVKFKPGTVVRSEALAEAEPVCPALAGSEWLRSEHIEKDAAQEYWYKVRYVDERGNEAEGYVHADQYVAYYVPENILSYEYMDNIERLAYTTQRDLTGTIRSHGVLLSLVTGGILEADGLGTEVTKVEVKPGKKEFFVKPSAINTIKIGELTPGSYIFVVSAQADYYVAYDAHTLKKLTERSVPINDPFEVYKEITCVLNGGHVNGSTEDLIVELVYGVADLPVPNKTGAQFRGWFTESSGGDPVTDDNYLKLDKVYAQWSESAPILQSIESDTSGVRLTWQALDGVNTYRVFRSDVMADGSRNWVSLGEVNGTSSLDGTGVAAAEYYYTVAGLVNGKETPKDEAGLYARCLRGLVDYGPAGDEALWLLYPDGTLSFVGNGYLYEYDIEDTYSEAFLNGAYPWYKHRDKVTKVVLGAQIQNIPRMAFYRFLGLKTVEGMQGLCYIGDGAFSESGIESLTVSAGVTSIGFGAFYGCKLSALAVAPGNSTYSVNGAALIEVSVWWGGTCLHTYWGKDASYEVPAGVTSIAPLAFAGNAYLKQLTLPESVVRIHTLAFKNSVALDWIKILAETGTVEEDAFVGCRTYFDYGIDGALHILVKQHLSPMSLSIKDVGIVIAQIDTPLGSGSRQKLKLNNNMDHIDISVENGNEGE